MVLSHATGYQAACSSQPSTVTLPSSLCVSMCHVFAVFSLLLHILQGVDMKVAVSNGVITMGELEGTKPT